MIYSSNSTHHHEDPVDDSDHNGENPSAVVTTVSSLGPEPLLIGRTQVDALYECLAALQQAFRDHQIPWILTAGDPYWHSILFCDDDIDVAVIGLDQLQVVRQHLAHWLGPNFSYSKAEGFCDRVRLKRVSNVFVDVFCIREYATEEDLRRVIGWKRNGQRQSEDYVQNILSAIRSAVASSSSSVDPQSNNSGNSNNNLHSWSVNTQPPVFPCWHFATRKAVELWPKEVFLPFELFPIQTDYVMGPCAQLPGPRMPLRLLYRAFGRDCMHVYYETVVGHHQHQPTKSNKQQHQTPSVGDDQCSTTVSATPLPPLVQPGGTWEGGRKAPLRPEQYLPMQPVARTKRRFDPHCREILFHWISQQAQQEAAWLQQQEKMHQQNVSEGTDLSPSPKLQQQKQSEEQPSSQSTKRTELPPAEQTSTLINVATPSPSPGVHHPRPRRTVYMDGVFDMFHVGHLHAIRQCVALGDRVVIGVTGDADATAYKRPPVVSQRDRVAIVAALQGMVDCVICPCPLIVTAEFMHKHGIDVVVHGFATDEDMERQREFFAVPMKMGCFKRIAYYPDLSTTDIIRKVQALPMVEVLDQEDPKEATAFKQNNSNNNWFGRALAQATSYAPSIPYNPVPLDLRTIMEPHLRKATHQRSAALHSFSATWTDTDLSALVNIGDEGFLEYDTVQHPLLSSLLSCVDWPSDTDLTQLHRDCHAKDAFLHSLTRSYQSFQRVFDRFVRSVCVPQLVSRLDSSTENDDTSKMSIYYQAFPCLRVVQPGEFSIGPHADIAYGHHPGSVNFYIPLTPIGGSDSNASSLFVESRPGSEDWHPITGDYGTITHFGGGTRLHWTTENSTAYTRVSLDVRLLPGTWCGDEATLLDPQNVDGGVPKDVYRRIPGYYACCRRRRRPTIGNTRNKNENGDNAEWVREGDLPAPDARVGFPWTTVKSWEKHFAKHKRHANGTNIY